MVDKKLSYPCLRVVMQFFDSDKRIQLAQHCPSLRFVEKAVPMKISFLFLGTSGVYINDTSYHVKVIRQYPPGGPKPFKVYQKKNDLDVSMYDLDEFGREDRSGDQVILSGDIPVETAHAPVVKRTEEEEDAYMEEQKTRLEHLKTLPKLKQREEDKDKIRARLFEWNLKKENKKAPYTMYLKYTKLNPDKTEKIEYIEYNRKQYEAAKYLCHFLLAGRKHPIKVRTLRITPSGGVLRLPGSLKIKPERLDFGSNFESIMNSVGHLLTTNHFETAQVQDGIHLGENHHHPVIQNAEKFNIYDVKMTGDLFHIVLNNNHKSLFVSKGELTMPEYMELLQRMCLDQRPAGTNYCFGVHSRALVKLIFRELLFWQAGKHKRRAAGKFRFPHFYSININNVSYISITCNKKINYKEKNQSQEPWNLWFQVLDYMKGDKTKEVMEKEDYIKQFNSTINGNKEVGTCHSIEVHSKRMVKEVIKEIKTRDGVCFRKEEKRGCSQFPYTYTIPIDDSSKFTVYCDRNKNLNKKGIKDKPWVLRVNVERNGQANREEYTSFLNKIIADKNKIGTCYPVGVHTKNEVKKFFSEVKKREGVTVKKSIRGSAKFPHTYTYPIEDTSNLVIFCDRKKHYNKNDVNDHPWVIWHCVEKNVKKPVDKKKN